MSSITQTHGTNPLDGSVAGSTHQDVFVRSGASYFPRGRTVQQAERDVIVQLEATANVLDQGSVELHDQLAGPCFRRALHETAHHALEHQHHEPGRKPVTGNIADPYPVAVVRGWNVVVVAAHF